MQTSKDSALWLYCHRKLWIRRNEPSIDSLIKLAEALDVTIDELVGIKQKSDELHLLSAFKKLDNRKKQTVLCLVDALLSP